jgi:hypothetical protein
MLSRVSPVTLVDTALLSLQLSDSSTLTPHHSFLDSQNMRSSEPASFRVTVIFD